VFGYLRFNNDDTNIPKDIKKLCLLFFHEIIPTFEWNTSLHKNNSHDLNIISSTQIEYKGDNKWKIAIMDCEISSSSISTLTWSLKVNSMSNDDEIDFIFGFIEKVDGINLINNWNTYFSGYRFHGVRVDYRYNDLTLCGSDYNWFRVDKQQYRFKSGDIFTLSLDNINNNVSLFYKSSKLKSKIEFVSNVFDKFKSNHIYVPAVSIGKASLETVEWTATEI